MSKEANIIVLGASARAAAFSALRAGMRPYAIDLFADSDLADVCPAVKISRYPQDFEQALTEAPQAPWIYTGGLENYPDLVERMSALRPLYGNGAEVLRRVRDPELLADCLARADSNFEMPEIRRSPPTSDYGHWLVKPRHSSGGLGIRRAQAHESPADQERFYYQQFVPGTCRSAVYLAQRGHCTVVGMTDQQCGLIDFPNQPFLYAGSALAGSSEFDLIEELGKVVAVEFGLRGFFNVDYIDHGISIFPLEINPRYSASVEILEHSRGTNFLAMHVAEFDPDFQGETRCWISRCPRHVAKRIVYAPCDCTVTPELNRLRRKWNVELLLPCLADIPHSGDRILRGQPVVTVIAEGASDAAVQQVLEERVNAVKQAILPA